VILNPAWEDGMSASIQAGMTGLPPKVDAMVFLVCDQPALDRAHLERLLAAHLGEPDRVVASRYGEIRGIPALFPRRAFPLLDRLRGDQGARALLQGLDVLEVPFPGGELDVDTPADLENLRR
jgi:molybdenum cofactor cytidylyltransferase